MKKIVIIGSGMGGLSAACLLAKAGHKVTVIEKNADFGGRNSQISEKGFTFPYGPTWFLMPEVFERFYKQMGEQTDKYFSLKLLKPYYRAYFKDTLIQPVEITGNVIADAASLENLEPGARKKLVDYLESCEERHELAAKHFIYRNYSSAVELLNRDNLGAALKTGLNRSMYDHVGQYFLNEQIKQIFTFPAVFLGTSPFKAPSVYSLLNNSIFSGGVFYPEGGMYSITSSLLDIAKKHKVALMPNCEATKILSSGQKVTGVLTKSGKIIKADSVISNAGLHHTELVLTGENDRSYLGRFWQRRQLSHSGVLLHLGVKGSLPDIPYHSFIFANNWKKQFEDIESSDKFPADPSIYLCHLSREDPKAAPKDHHSLLAIIPTARNISYTAGDLQNFSEKVIESIGKALGIKDLRGRVIYKKPLAGRDFEESYNAYEGSMLGLSHKFGQTGPFRPQNISNKLDNLYYVGADTVPGIGVPMCLISAELVAQRILKS